MLRQREILLTAYVFLALGLPCPAKTSKLAGKLVAYDVLRHAAKSASFVQNEEVVVLETSGQKEKYVKVVFSSFSTTQIDPKYFDGMLSLDVDVLRDKSCDEREPRLVPQVSLEHMAGTYLLTTAFKDHPPAQIKTLKCYAAIYKKK